MEPSGSARMQDSVTFGVMVGQASPIERVDVFGVRVTVGRFIYENSALLCKVETSFASKLSEHDLCNRKLYAFL